MVVDLALYIFVGNVLHVEDAEQLPEGASFQVPGYFFVCKISIYDSDDVFLIFVWP